MKMYLFVSFVMFSPRWMRRTVLKYLTMRTMMHQAERKSLISIIAVTRTILAINTSRQNTHYTFALDVPCL